MEDITSLQVLLMHARAELASAKITLGELGSQLDSERIKNGNLIYGALMNAVWQLDGTLSLDSQSLLAGIDTSLRYQKIQALFAKLEDLHRQAQNLLEAR